MQINNSNGNMDEFDLQGSFVTTVASSLDLVFQLVPDKGAFAILGEDFSDSSSSTLDHRLNDTSVVYQLKYLLSVQVANKVNPVVTLKLVTILSLIAKVSWHLI